MFLKKIKENKLALYNLIIPLCEKHFQKVSDLSKTSSYLDVQNGNSLSKTVTYYSTIAPITSNNTTTLIPEQLEKAALDKNIDTFGRALVISFCRSNYHQNSLLLAMENIKHENEVITIKISSNSI